MRRSETADWFPNRLTTNVPTSLPLVTVSVAKLALSRSSFRGPSSTVVTCPVWERQIGQRFDLLNLLLTRGTFPMERIRRARPSRAQPTVLASGSTERRREPTTRSANHGRCSERGGTSAYWALRRVRRPACPPRLVARGECRGLLAAGLVEMSRVVQLRQWHENSSTAVAMPVVLTFQSIGLTSRRL